MIVALDIWDIFDISKFDLWWEAIQISLSQTKIWQAFMDCFEEALISLIACCVGIAIYRRL